MKIKLKSLRLPRTTGYLLRPVDVNASSSDYAQPSNFFGEAYYQEMTGVIAGERLGTQNNTWIPYNAFNPLIVLRRSDKLILDLLIYPQSLLIDTIEWQSGNTVRYTFIADQNLRNIVLNTWFKFANCTDTTNNDIYKIVATGNNYLDVINPDVSDDSHDEQDSECTLTQILTEFEIDDLKREIHSQFEEHYQLTIYQKNV